MRFLWTASGLAVTVSKQHIPAECSTYLNSVGAPDPIFHAVEGNNIIVCGQGGSLILIGHGFVKSFHYFGVLGVGASLGGLRLAGVVGDEELLPVQVGENAAQ